MTASQALRELFSNAPTETDSYRLAMDAAEEIDRLRASNKELVQACMRLGGHLLMIKPYENSVYLKQKLEADLSKAQCACREATEGKP